MNFRKENLDAFNRNVLLITLKNLSEGLLEVAAYTDKLNQGRAPNKIVVLDEIYNSIFKNLEGLELTIKKIPKSTVALFSNPEFIHPSNFVNHISIQITSVQLQLLNSTYEDRLGKLLRFYKHLYSKVYNFLISMGSTQIVKYRKLIDQVNAEYENFLNTTNKREILKKRQILDESIFKNIKNKSFFYIAHIDNLESILTYGILSHNLAHSKGLVKKDISYSSVQEKRERFVNDINGSIHDFVPLYINHKTPMLYVKMRSIEKNELILLRVNPHILLTDNIFFTDGNAASRSTRFYNNLTSFNNLKWEVINGEHFINSTEFKRAKSSEVLKKDQIPIEYLSEIYLQNENHLEKVIQLFPNHLGISIRIDNSLFYGN